MVSYLALHSVALEVKRASRAISTSRLIKVTTSKPSWLDAIAEVEDFSAASNALTVARPP
jgi:hypothetical protein